MPKLGATRITLPEGIPVPGKDYNYRVVAQHLQPYRAAKENFDITRLVYDFSQYLDPGEVLMGVYNSTIYVPPLCQDATNWRQDYPVDNTVPAVPPVDTYPLHVFTQVVGAGGTSIEVEVVDGTPAFTYAVSFATVAATSQRRKQVDTLVTIEKPVNPLMLGVTVLPTPIPPTPIIPTPPAVPPVYLDNTGLVTALTDGVATSLVGLTLGAGDWLVGGAAYFNTGNALNYRFLAGVNAVSGVLPAAPLYAQISPDGAISGTEWNLVVPQRRFRLAAPTSVYLVARADFGTGSPATGIGYINAQGVEGVFVVGVSEVGGPDTLGAVPS
jgi:hypothetical protein